MATAVRNKRGKSSPSTTKKTPEASSPLISDAKLRQLYATMLECRLLSERILDQFPQAPRRAAATAPFVRKEAAIVGAALDLGPDDWLVPPPNDAVGRFIKGAPLAAIFAELRQSNTKRPPIAAQPTPAAPGKRPRAHHVVAGPAEAYAQINLASGLALALQASKPSPAQGHVQGHVAMAFCADTPASVQQCRDALAFAASHTLPLLVLLLAKAPAKATDPKKGKPGAGLLDEANPCGVPNIPVDADDAVAVYRVAHESIHKARHNGGPTLITAISFPAAGRATPPARPDPIAKMEEYLAARRLFSPAWKQKLIDSFHRKADAAIARAQPAPARTAAKKRPPAK
jgi:TPP-dependent pyruvate/acetoin dehydrogenase alpha subunit